jgi:hypothetical protein
MTVEEREVVHLLVLSRQPGFPWYVRVDTDSKGHRCFRLVAKLLSAASIWLLMVATALAQPLVINYQSLPSFSALTPALVGAIAQKRVLYVNRSVGNNIAGPRGGLDCLNFPTDEQAYTVCRRNHPVAIYQSPSTETDWNMPGGYPRANITFIGWDTICTGGEWYSLPPCILDYFMAHINEYDVFMLNISYLEMGAGIESVTDGWFARQSPRFNITHYETWEAEHPDKKFIYMLPSIARNIGNSTMSQHLAQWRTYIQQRSSGVFLDLPSIESHDPWGNPCWDNRDGVPYTNPSNGQSENWPDDGEAHEAICQQYTTETDGGHTGNPAAGNIRNAKGIWLALNAAINQESTPPPPPPPPDTEPPTVECSWDSALPAISLVLTCRFQDNLSIEQLRVGDFFAVDSGGNVIQNPPTIILP